VCFTARGSAGAGDFFVVETRANDPPPPPSPAPESQPTVVRRTGSYPLSVQPVATRELGQFFLSPLLRTSVHNWQKGPPRDGVAAAGLCGGGPRWGERRPSSLRGPFLAADRRVLGTGIVAEFVKVGGEAAATRRYAQALALLPRAPARRIVGSDPGDGRPSPAF